MQNLLCQHGRTPGDIDFFYTTCPRCVTVFGKTYAVGVVKTCAS